MITLHQIVKFYGKQDVLKGVSLQISPGERVGLVGPNGAGKSTILRLILNEVEPDGGSVFKAKGLNIGHLPQDLLSLSGQSPLALAMDSGRRLPAIEAELDEVHQALANNPSPRDTDELIERQGRLQTAFEQLGGYDLEARASKVLAGLGFKPDQFNRDLSELSGGWLMRAALARILLSAPDVVLLDEPTNHLDMESLIWLENYLIKSPAALMLVSHDRAFLDKVVTRIVEVEDGQIYTYGGNYSLYQEQRAARRKAQISAYEAQQAEIKEMERFIDRNRARKSSARQVQSRIRALDKMERLTLPPSEEAVSLSLPPVERSANVVAELDGVSLGYGDKVVYRDLTLVVPRQQKLALLGRNGEGKTTVLRALAGIVEPMRGRRLIGGRVKMGIFNQHAIENLNQENDVLSELGSVAGYMPLSRQRSALGAFLFRGDDVFKKVKVLSGGEKSRLVLAKLLLSQPNFLLLDEPTNHLDITSRMVLEKALVEYDGTVILVSHDRRLINAICDHVGYVADGKLTVFPGNYTDFERIWKSRLEPPDEAKPAPAPAPQPKQEPDPPKQAAASGKKDAATKRAEAAERQRRYQKLKPLQKKVAASEAEVDKATAALKKVESEMAACGDPNLWPELSKKHAEAQSCLDRVSGEWEELAMKLEEAEARLED